MMCQITQFNYVPIVAITNFLNFLTEFIFIFQNNFFTAENENGAVNREFTQNFIYNGRRI